MKTILVTGGAGFIGRHILKAFGHEEATIVSVDINYPELKHTGNRVEIPCNLLDTEKLKSVFRQYKPDVVIHLAALTGVRASSQYPGDYWSHNIGGTNNLLDVMKEFNACKIVFASSSSVYGDMEAHQYPSLEYYECNPRSVYGVTKLAGEKLLKTYHELYGLDFIALRLFNVYGTNMRENLFIHKVFDKLRKDDDIVIYGDGNQSRDFTHVRDVCRAFRYSVNVLESRKDISLVLNICTGESTSINFLVGMIGGMYQKGGDNTKVIRHPAYLEDVARTQGDYNRAKNAIGWTPEFKLKAGLEEIKYSFK